MFIHDMEAHFLEINDAACIRLAYTKEELLKMTPMAIDSKEYADLVKERIEELKKYGSIIFETVHVAKNGTRIPTEISCKVIYFNNAPAILSAARDITSRKYFQEALQEREAQLRRITDNMLDMICQTDASGIYCYVSPSYQNILGYKPEEFLGKSIFDFLHPDDMERVATAVWNAIINRTSGKEEFRYRHAAGHYIWQETTGNLLFSDTGDILGAVFAGRDITERKQAEELIRHYAYHDGLTGLPNRMLYTDRLNMAISQAERNKQKLVVMMLDLDKFKDVNDTLGHQMGDRLLHDIAQRLTLLLRKGDTIARIGGDEFVVLLSEVSNAIDDSRRIAKKITDTFQETFSLDGHKIRITISIGIALYPDDGRDLETLIRHADKAMYSAKDAGRNTYRHYHPKLAETP